MEQPEINHEASNDKAPPATWGDVAEASDRQPTREEVEDVIEVRLTEADLADIARQNATDDEERASIQRAIDDLKGDLKDKKAELASVEARIRERHSNVRRGVQSKKGKWILEELFAANTVRYLDPKTEAVVLERAMTTGERQTELALDVVATAIANGAAKAADVEAASNDDASVTDPAALLEAAQRGDTSDEEEDFEDFADDDDDEDE